MRCNPTEIAVVLKWIHDIQISIFNSVLLPHQRTISYSRIEQKHCCTCNMGKRLQISILSVSQTKELTTDTGNRDQVFLATPLGLFSNLPLPITSCVKTYETYETELWWLLLLADIFRRQNVEVSKCDRFCPGNFIVWSLDMSREFP